MPTVDCCDCGRPFWREAGQEWRLRCVPCWRASQADRGAVVDRHRHRLEVVDELQQNLRGLRQLCHPDRHENSALSTRVSQWLGTVKERLEVDR